MYEFYRNVYQGTAIEEEEFPELLARAKDQLALYRRSYRIEANHQEEMMALCAMAEVIGYFEAAQNGEGGLRYASVGTVSISGKGIYSAIDINPTAQAKQIYKAAERYLRIYRGCGGSA